MSDARSTVVEVNLNLWRVRYRGAAKPVRTRLRYDIDDPYSVNIHLYPQSPREAEVADRWFARDLLIDGLDKPVGLGDVSVRPWISPGNEFVVLSLLNPHDVTQLKIPRRKLTRFLQRTYLLVPKGCENQHLDIDRLAEQLLS